MSKCVTIVDYGLGNLFSVHRAFESLGYRAHISHVADEIVRSDRLVLPGVGAFSDGMAEMKSRELVGPVLEFIRQGRPFLGICLGMQMMFDRSHEFGVIEGLGIISGEVRKIESPTFKGKSLQIPHIGWSPLLPNDQQRPWTGTPLGEVDRGATAYFLHSFAATSKVVGDTLAQTFYGDQKIVAAVGVDNAFGCQFHPERSGPTGLRIINSFMSL